VDDTQTIKIWVKGDYVDAKALAQTLQDDGFNVEYQPPTYIGKRRGRAYWDLELSTDIQQLVVTTVGTVASVGLVAAIKASVSKYRKHNLRAEVTIEGVDEKPVDGQDAAAEQEGPAPSAGRPEES
jgi:hypothetical protein